MVTEKKKKNEKTRTCRIVDLAVSVNHRVRLKESEKRDKYGPYKRVEETMEHEGDDDIICNWCTWNNPQRIGKTSRRLGNKRTRGDPPYSIVWIS